MRLSQLPSGERAAQGYQRCGVPTKSSSTGRRAGTGASDGVTPSLGWSHESSSIVIGAHVEQTDPVAEARARETTLVQFFLGDPQGYKGPEVRYAGGADRPAGGCRVGRHRPLRARALHRQRRDHQQPHPDPEPQAAPAAHGRGGRDRREGPDRPRRPRQQVRRPRQGLRQLAQGRRGHRHQDPAAHREHRRRRQRDDPSPRPDRRRVGRHLLRRGLRGRRLRAGHLPRLGRRHRARHRRGEGPLDHRPDRPGPRQRQPRRLRLRCRPARQLRRRPARRRRSSRASSAPPARRWSARPRADPRSTGPTSRGCASTGSEASRAAPCWGPARRSRSSAGCSDPPRTSTTRVRRIRYADEHPDQFADLRLPDRTRSARSCCCTAATGCRATTSTSSTRSPT